MDAQVRPTRIAWEPNPGPQTAAIHCPVEDVFYGGSRGGGKSIYLLGDVAVRGNRYGRKFSAIIFRRTYDELDDLKKKAQAIYPLIGAVWQASERTWVFPGGATLKMRYLESDDDASRYQGHEYQWVGVDEVGNFSSPAPIDLLRACLRTTDNIPCVMRLTGNPGGPGHEWLKHRYVTRSRPMVPFMDESDGVSVQRVFIPAFLKDNPKLSEPEKYVARIKSSGPKWLVKAWLEGDWSGRPTGGLLDPNRINLYDEEPRWKMRKLGLHPVCYWDFAVTEKDLQSADDPDYTACLVVAREGANMYLLDAWREQCAPDVTARQIINLQRKWQARVKGEKGVIEKCIQVPLRMICTQIDYQVVLEAITKGRIDKVQHSIGFQMILGSGNVWAPRHAPWLKDYTHELSTFPTQGTEIHDDWVDCSSYAAQDMMGQKSANLDPSVLGVKGFTPELTYAMQERYQAERRRREGEDAGGDGRDDFFG
jgi:predicted phage terminase large subunit-like protein